MPDINSIEKLLSLNPSWSMVALASLLGVLFLIWQLSKNTELTKIMVKGVEAMAPLSETVHEIREDQKKSNSERAEHGKRLERLEADIEELKTRSCNNAPICGNRA